MNRQVSRGSAGYYHADEHGRCRAAQFSIIKQMSRQVSAAQLAIIKQMSRQVSAAQLAIIKQMSRQVSRGSAGHSQAEDGIRDFLL